MAEQQQIRYNEGWIGRSSDVAGEGIGCLDLWVGKDGLQVKQLPTGDEVGEMLMNGHFAGPSGVKYALGEDILGDDGVIFVRASFWNYQLERIKKLTISHGMRMRIYGKFVVETYPRQDGTTGKAVKVNVQNFVFSYNPNRENGNTQVSQTQPQPQQTVPQAPQVNVPF